MFGASNVWATTYPPETIEQTILHGTTPRGLLATYFGGRTRIIRDRYYMESTIPREEA